MAPVVAVFRRADVAMVVGAPDVDDEVEAAADELVPVVGDIAGVVGRAPIGADDDVVFVFAQLARCEPERAFALGQWRPSRAEAP